jgi:hypothetical protein
MGASMLYKVNQAEKNLFAHTQAHAGWHGKQKDLTMLDTPKPDTQIDLEEYLADLEEHLADIEEQADRNDHDRAQEGNQ